MKVKAALTLATILVGLALAPTTGVQAQGSNPSDDQMTGNQEGPRFINQAELAERLVRILGLSRFVSASPTTQEVISLLMQNNIRPAEGWKPKELVTKADMAVIMVRIFDKRGRDITITDNGSEREVDTSDPVEAVKYLNQIGLTDWSTDPEAIGEHASVTSIDELSKKEQIRLREAIAGYGYKTEGSTDPLVRQAKRERPDDIEAQTDVGVNPRFLTETQVISLFRRAEEAPAEPPEPQPVTPDGGV